MMECGESNLQCTSIPKENNAAVYVVADDCRNKDERSEITIQKTPVKVLHFSDGTLEEYESEEDEVDAAPVQYSSAINPKNLAWVPWMWYQTTVVGSVSLKACDYVGEMLASFFGITTPKYQYEIDEYKRMVAEEEERKTKEDLEMRGWNQDSTSTPDDIVQTTQASSPGTGDINQRF